MQHLRGVSNAHSLFSIQNIPTDNQIRNMLDPIPASQLNVMFDNIYNGLNSVGYFQHYRLNSINESLLIALDGVNYFSSNKISCKRCNTKHHRDDKTGFYHYAVTPVIVAYKNPRVIPMAPEFITQQDGHEKQDGEHAAVKRWLKINGIKLKNSNITILGQEFPVYPPVLGPATSKIYRQSIYLAAFRPF